MKKTLLLLAICFAANVYQAYACTNFLVGKNATADGSTIISYAADSYSFYGFLRYRSEEDHQPGEMRKVVCWDDGKPLMEIPQVPHTYTVVGNMNQHQLTIGETTWGGQELANKTGIDYGSLIYIALERCKTAREAIQCMTDLVAQYGYCSGGESFSIADPNEVWLMDMIGNGADNTGAVWVAVRIPDDCISAHANQSRITFLPVKEKTKKSGNAIVTKDGNWMWHKDVIQLARDKGYFSGKDAEFQFNQAYNPFDFGGLYICEARVWAMMRKFDKNLDIYKDYATGKTFLATGGKETGDPMPLYIRPDHKVTLADVRACMRDQYEGTDIAITEGVDAGPWHSKLRHGSLGFKLDSVQYWYERPVATQQTAWSFIAQMRGYANDRARGIFWFGVDDAATTLYIPMYCTINEAPECMREGNGDLYTYSPTSAWWAWNRVANWAYTKYSYMRQDIAKLQTAWEDKFDSQIALIDSQVANLNDAEARAFLTRYSCTQANEATAAWNELFNYLMVKYLDGQIRKEENGQFLRNEWGEPTSPNRPAYPEEWLRLISPGIWHE